MDELEKRKLVDAYNEVARNVCEAVLDLDPVINGHRFERVCKELFEREKALNLQAKQNGFKFVEVPPGPGETRVWAEFELQELNTNTCN